jgi:hypothetical protein
MNRPLLASLLVLPARTAAPPRSPTAPPGRTPRAGYRRAGYLASVVTYSGGQLAAIPDLLAAGRFDFICDHGLGHRIPPDVGASVWRFLQDHPFGTKPSPYAAALPAGFPAYCGLQTETPANFPAYPAL